LFLEDEKMILRSKKEFSCPPKSEISDVNKTYNIIR
jgi:hypothetical protein